MYWSSSDVSTLEDETRIMRWAGDVVRTGNRRDVYGVLVGVKGKVNFTLVQAVRPIGGVEV